MFYKQLVLLSAALIVLAGCQQRVDTSVGASTLKPDLPKTTGQDVSDTTAGRLIYRDPTTGQLGNAPASTAASLTGSQAQSRPVITESVADDGTVTYKYQGGFKMNLIAVIDCDGNLVTTHSSSAEPPAQDCKPPADDNKEIQP